jgi:hypothetical protein
VNKIEAEKLGYTLCNGQIIECGNDAGGIPMYCYQKAAMPETKHVPGKLIIEPAQDRNPVGTKHTLTFTLYDTNGQPLPYVRIYISHTGANTLAPIELVTDASGKNSYSYTGNKVGTDFITAKVDNLVASATKEWYEQTTQIKPAKITLTPVNASNAPGKLHTVTATVTGSDGKPMGGVDVTFSITGVNNFARHATTDTSGRASISYTSKKEGKDTITATAGGLKATATKWWEIIE